MRSVGVVVAPFLLRCRPVGRPKAVRPFGYALRPAIDGIHGGLRLVRRGKGMHGQKFAVRKTG
jgi:hypothetical protein